MKNRVKVIGISIVVIALLLILIITGCFKSKGEKTITTAYENSKITEEMKGYVLDLRIYGSIKNVNYNKIIRVNNYMNKEYSIYSYNNGTENNYVVKDGKAYINKKSKYEVTTIDGYTKPDSYLNGLDGVKKANKKEDQKIGELTYKVYEVSFNKKNVNEMLKDTDLKLTVDKDIEGEVWINPDGRIYRIYYKIDKLTIYASYFGYNTPSPVTINAK